MSNDSVVDPENPGVGPQDETAYLVQKLKDLVPEADELHKCVEKVAWDYQQKLTEDLDKVNHLLEAFITVLKERTPPKPNKKDTWSFQRPAFWKSAVKVFPVVTAKTFGADTQILSKVNVDVCDSPADCDVVVVFCPVTSRVGSDVDDAMRNIPGGANGKKVILLVMHHSRKDISPAEALLNHGHQNVILDVHIVYHETVQGLIKCATNDRAIQKLKDWCKNFSA